MANFPIGRLRARRESHFSTQKARRFQGFARRVCQRRFVIVESDRAQRFRDMSVRAGRRRPRCGSNQKPDTWCRCSVGFRRGRCPRRWRARGRWARTSRRPCAPGCDGLGPPRRRWLAPPRNSRASSFFLARRKTPAVLGMGHIPTFRLRLAAKFCRDRQPGDAPARKVFPAHRAA